MSESTSQLPASGPVDPELESGTRVGEYVVDGKLGEGAFGIVFRGTHPIIGKVVAIKVLARKFSVDPEMVSRFIAEAKAVNQIRHRNIIDIFSFGQLDGDGRQYYVMEYLDGEPLDALLDRHGKLALVEALPILRGIARALDAAHAKGVAHRDLKAENVFLATDGDNGGVWPKLLDFGIAKLMAPEDGIKHKTRTGTPVGTPYYMSPEQCRGRDVDHRTDIYAFGVLAYLMLTGQYPHDAEDYMSILMRQLTEEPSAPSTLAPELPPGIDEAIAWFLKKDPGARPSTLRLGMQALEAAAGEAGITLGTAGWDAQVQTGPIGRIASRGFAESSDTRPPHTAPAKAPSNPPPGSKLASQKTMAVEDLEPAAASKKSRLPLVLAGLAIAAAAAIALAIVRPWASSSDEARSPEKYVLVPAIVDAAPAPQPQPQPRPQPGPKPVDIQTVIVEVAGVPDGTEVFVAGMTAGAAPGPVQLPRDSAPIVLTFKVDGYFPASRTVTPDRDQKLVVQLKKKPTGAPAKRPPSKDDIIDVFGKKP